MDPALLTARVPPPLLVAVVARSANLQEIFRGLYLHMGRILQGSIPLVLRRRIKDVEVHPTTGADFQDARSVPAAVAVVWGGPDGREAVVEEDAKTLHAQLVGTQDV